MGLGTKRKAHNLVMTSRNQELSLGGPFEGTNTSYFIISYTVLEDTAAIWRRKWHEDEKIKPSCFL
jgi:hypothetical protein